MSDLFGVGMKLFPAFFGQAKGVFSPFTQGDFDHFIEDQRIQRIWNLKKTDMSTS